MPRRSAADMAVIAAAPNARLPIAPPPNLSEPEREIFRTVVGALRPDHFRPSDGPLLAAYCAAHLLEREAFAALTAEGSLRNGKESPWLRVHTTQSKLLSMLSTKLRLAPSSRFNNRHAARTAAAVADNAARRIDWNQHFKERGRKK